MADPDLPAPGLEGRHLLRDLPHRRDDQPPRQLGGRVGKRARAADHDASLGGRREYDRLGKEFAVQREHRIRLYTATRLAELCADALHESLSGARSFEAAMGQYQLTRDERVLPMYEFTTQLATLFEEIFKRYAKASAIGFATIPSTDEGGLSIAAVNRMIAAAVRGVQARSR